MVGKGGALSPSSLIAGAHGSSAAHHGFAPIGSAGASRGDAAGHGRSRSFEDISVLEESWASDSDASWYHEDMPEDGEEVDLDDSMMERSSSDLAAAAAGAPDRVRADTMPLHARFQRRLAAEVEAELRRAAGCRGEARAAIVRQLFHNITAQVEPSVAAQLRASGWPGRAPHHYYHLLAEHFASSEVSSGHLGALLRMRRVWAQLVSCDLFPAVWSALFFLWFLGGFEPVTLQAPGGTDDASLRHTHQDGTPASLGESAAHDESVVDEQDQHPPQRRRQRRRLGTDDDSRDDERGAASLERLPAPEPWVERDADFESRMVGPPRTRAMLELLTAGASRLFWLDAHACTTSFSTIFGVLLAAVLDPSKLASIPAPCRRELAAVVACHFLHYRGDRVHSIRALLLNLPDLDTGMMAHGARLSGPDDGELVRHGPPEKRLSASSLADSAGTLREWTPALGSPSLLTLEGSMVLGSREGSSGSVADTPPVGDDPDVGTRLIARAGQFVDEAIVHLRALENQASVERYIHGLASLSGLPLSRVVANRLHTALHQFATPGGPRFPPRRVREAASATIDTLFPHGSAVRRVVHLAFRLLHPVRACTSACHWTGTAAVACATRTAYAPVACGRFVRGLWCVRLTEAVAGWTWSVSMSCASSVTGLAWTIADRTLMAPPRILVQVVWSVLSSDSKYP